MPYKIEERDGKYCVVKETDGTTVHCHETREAAEEQVRALYANEGIGKEEILRCAQNDVWKVSRNRWLILCHL